MTEKRGFWIGIVLACLGIVGPMLWDSWSKRTDLTAELISTSPIVNSSVEEKNLVVEYAGKPVDSAYQLVVKITNTGRTSISASEVIEPITLTLKDASILTAKITDQKPLNLNPKISREANTVKIFSKLLNPDDYIIASIIAETKSPNIAAAARIKGLSAINLVTPDDRQFNYPLAVSAFGIFVVVVIFGALCVEGLRARNRLINAAKSIKEQAHPILDAKDKYEALKIFITELKDVTDDRAQSIREVIDSSEWPLDKQDKTPFSHKIVNQVEKEPNLAWVILAAVLMGVFAVDLVQKARILFA